MSNPIPGELASNPFLRVYDAMADLLLGDEATNKLAQMISENNRRTYGTALGSNRDVKAPGLLSADVPELILVDEGGEYNESANSGHASYVMSLSLYVSTGDLRYWAYASLINWYIACNMSQWHTKLSAVTWCGNTMVTNLRNVPIQIGTTNPQNPQQINGFSVMWRCQIEMYIPHAHLVHTEII